MKSILFILPIMLVVGIFSFSPRPVEATFDFNPCLYVPQLCASPSPSVSPSPSIEPSVEPSASVEPSSSPSEEPSATPSASPAQGNPGLTDPGPGGTSGSDGKPTYDPNRSDRGGKDPVVPKAAPATGFGPR